MGLFKCCCLTSTPPACCEGSWTPPNISMSGYTASSSGWSVLGGCCSNKFFTPNTPVEDYLCPGPHRTRKVTSYCKHSSYYVDVKRRAITATSHCDDSVTWTTGDPCIGDLKLCATLEYTTEVTDEKRRVVRFKELSREVRINKVTQDCAGVRSCAYLLTVKIHKQATIFTYHRRVATETRVISDGCCSVSDLAAGTTTTTVAIPTLPADCKDQFDYVTSLDWGALVSAYGLTAPTTTTVNYDIVKTVLLSSIPSSAWSTTMGSSSTSTCTVVDTLPLACPAITDTPATTCFNVGHGTAFPTCVSPEVTDIGVGVGVACVYVAYTTLSCGTANWLVTGPNALDNDGHAPPWPTVVLRTYSIKFLDPDVALNCFVCNSYDMTWRSGNTGITCTETACPCYWNEAGWCCDLDALATFSNAGHTKAGYCYHGPVAAGQISAVANCLLPKGRVVVPSALDELSQTVLYDTGIDTTSTESGFICVDNNQTFSITFPS